MIKYALICIHDHEFDAWFADSGSYDSQAAGGLIACPICNDSRVAKAIMAPYVARKDKQSLTKTDMGVKTSEPQAENAFAMAKELIQWVKKNSDDVGWQFAAETQKMIEGEVEPRPIHGQATNEEVTELRSQGAPIVSLPTMVPKKMLS